MVFDVFQPAQGAVDFVLGVLAHAASVKQNCVGLPGAGNQFITRRQQVGRDQLAVEHVHLAADSLDVKALRHEI
jgi:hypothetical protein